MKKKINYAAYGIAISLLPIISFTHKDNWKLLTHFKK